MAYLQENDDATDGCTQLTEIFIVPLHESGECNGLVIAMDPYGIRAYVVLGFMIFSVDIASKMFWSNPVPTNTSLLIHKQLLEFRFVDSVNIDQPLSYKSLFISIRNEAELVAVGIPYLDLVLIFSAHLRKDLILIKEHNFFISGVGFGQPVDFISDNTYAVLVHEFTTLPWSRLQIQVSTKYRNISISLFISTKTQVYHLFDGSSSTTHFLLFVFLNNQQPTPIETTRKEPYHLVELIHWKEGGIILLKSSPKQD